VRRSTIDAMVSTVFGKILTFLQRQQVQFHMSKMHVGERVRIKPGLVVAYPSNIVIEDGVTITVNCVLQAHAPIHIGCHTLIAPNCTILTASHDMSERGDDTRRALIAKPVTIGSDCWLGAGVTVLPGVTIGEGVVVGAGSVVTRDLPPGMVCLGAPAKPVKVRPLGSETPGKTI